MSFPKAPFPSIAANAAYPSGTDPWSSTATKVVPSSDILQNGFTPETRQAAQYTNWLLNALCQYGDVLRILPVNNWTVVSDASLGSTEDVCEVIYDATLAMWFRTTRGTSHLDYSTDRVNWTKLTIATFGGGSNNILAIGCTGSGVVLAAVHNASSGHLNIYRSTNGTTWATSATGVAMDYGTDAETIQLLWDATNALFILSGFTFSSPNYTAAIWTSPVAATTWTLHTLTGATAGVSPTTQHMATDGAGHTVFADKQSSAIWRSSDGVTWLASSNPPVDSHGGSVNINGLCWDDRDSLFKLVDTAGLIQVSTVGDSWDSVDGGYVTIPVLGGAANAKGLAYGNGVLMTGDTTTSGVTKLCYSFDGGVTWSSRIEGQWTIQRVRFVTGQFFLCCQHNATAATRAFLYSIDLRG